MSSPPLPGGRRAVGTATLVLTALADAAVVLLFAASGRSSHSEGVTLAGVATTAWPFLAGTALGWLVVRLRGGAWPVPGGAGPRDTAVDGVLVAAAAVAGGMLLRRATGAGTDPAFVLVATAVLGASLVGWRLAWSLLRRRSRPTWGRRSSARLGG